MKNNGVTIKEVLTAKEHLSFVQFPEKLYRDEPNWVCPIRWDELNILKKDRNASYEYCDSKLFLAFKGEEIVGRVAAIVNHKSNSAWGEKRMRFGWIDFIDDADVSGALMAKVEEWAAELSFEIVSGPQGFNDLDKQGMLVEGFENLSTSQTIYNFPYYVTHLESLGYSKEVDWSQRTLNIPDKVPEKLAAFSQIVKDRYGVKILGKVSSRKLRHYGRELFKAYNRSYTPLYCFNTVTEREIEGVLKQFIPMVDQKFLSIVLDKEDRVVAFAVTIPTISKALNKAKGRLLPMGIIHIKRALMKYELLDMYIIGVVPEYQNKGLNAVIFHHLHQNFIKYGVKKVIAYPQLESNTAVIRLFDYYPMEPYMVRRCVCKKL
ncbi:MAG: N-acetyltransferase [Bacteroidales bacterium]|nr:N-acetyltransferase [Bacteroidales bacterium]